MAPKYRFTPGTAKPLDGPRVHVGPSEPGRKDGFDAILRDYSDEPSGRVATVWCLKKNRECWRTVLASRITVKRRRHGTDDDVG